MGKKIRVLVIDDSASVRQVLTRVLEEDPDIEVIGAASDPFMAAKKIQEQIPDVITLDVEMPRMDGITFLRKLMSQRPIPVVMCSSLTEAGSETLLQALEAWIETGDAPDTTMVQALCRDQVDAVSSCRFVTP